MNFLIISAAETSTPGGASMAILITAVLGAGGIGAIIAAVVAGLFSKRKLGAEATEIITKAAASVVTNLESELKRQIKARETAEVENCTRMQRMAAAHVAEREEWRRVLQLHVAWDAIAIAKMGGVGIELPPTPPLLPANRYVDTEGFPIH